MYQFFEPRKFEPSDVKKTIYSYYLFQGMNRVIISTWGHQALDTIWTTFD